MSIKNYKNVYITPLSENDKVSNLKDDTENISPRQWTDNGDTGDGGTNVRLSVGVETRLGPGSVTDHRPEMEVQSVKETIISHGNAIKNLAQVRTTIFTGCYLHLMCRT